MMADRGAWAIELLTEHNPQIERGEVRRRFREVAEVWHGPAEELWWRWCVETATSLGITLKVLDCTPAEAAQLAREGVHLIGFIPDEGEHEWVTILGNTNQKIQLYRASEPERQEDNSPRSLRRWLDRHAENDILRFVVYDSSRSSAAKQLSTAGPIKPLARLQQLLKPEWSDIWIVITFAFVVGVLTLATPIAVESLVNTVAFGRFLQPVVVLAIILFTFLGFSAAIRALQTYVVEIIQQRLFARVAADLSYRLPRARTESTDKHYMPELVNRFFDVVTVQKVSAQLLLDGVGLVLSTFIGMTVLAFYHPWLFGFDLLLLAAITFLITVLGRGAIQSAIKESKTKYNMASWFEDVSRCPVTFRSDGGIDYASEQSDHLIKDYLLARRKHFRVLMRQIIFALGLQAIASTVLLGLGGWLVVSGELTLGQLVAAELIVTVIVGGFAKLGKHMESFYDLLASVDKLGALFDLPRERDDGLLIVDDGAPASVNVQNASYSKSGSAVRLRDVSFALHPGGSLALIGPAGSGKSTALDLIYGLRNPSSGHVTINGFDPGDLRPDRLRRQVTLVRGPEVFQGTVAENVHLHRPEVTSQRVRDTLEQVGLLDWVLQLEESIETPIISGGKPFSESQCRLLAIARAIAGQPDLLLVDGILDGLPDRDLSRVMNLLCSPGRSWTLIIATGREDIAQRCDEQERLANGSPSVLVPQSV